MSVTNMRVVQLWDISPEGENIPITHYFEIQRNNDDKWEQLEVVNALRKDYSKKEEEDLVIEGTS